MQYVVPTQLGLVLVCKYKEGGLGRGYMPTGLDADEHHKWPMANISIGPCGLGC